MKLFFPMNSMHYYYPTNTVTVSVRAFQTPHAFILYFFLYRTQKRILPWKHNHPSFFLHLLFLRCRHHVSLKTLLHSHTFFLSFPFLSRFFRILFQIKEKEKRKSTKWKYSIELCTVKLKHERERGKISGLASKEKCFSDVILKFSATWYWKYFLYHIVTILLAGKICSNPNAWNTNLYYYLHNISSKNVSFLDETRSKHSLRFVVKVKVFFPFL